MEEIQFSLGKGELNHITPSEVKKIKINKRDKGMQEALAYMEKYTTESGFKIQQIVTTNIYFHVFLVKE
ncbi:MAG: hypothetical protein GF364_19930 [Candidatus Lokiarchaeota archaeon]|nr:hypothetical protein [Candidatus Lokiarchaeota archaeon]